MSLLRKMMKRRKSKPVSLAVLRQMQIRYEVILVSGISKYLIVISYNYGSMSLGVTE